MAWWTFAAAVLDDEGSERWVHCWRQCSRRGYVHSAVEVTNDAVVVAVVVAAAIVRIASMIPRPSDGVTVLYRTPQCQDWCGCGTDDATDVVVVVVAAIVVVAFVATAIATNWIPSFPPGADHGLDHDFDRGVGSDTTVGARPW